MKSETEDNFWKAWVEPLPESAPIFFRLYYDEKGEPLSYSMEELPGNYIDIDAETYARSSFLVRVIDNKLVHVAPKKIINKLVPDDIGVSCYEHNVSIVVDETYPHIKWSLRSNESD
jgi:hypothetical protein